MYIMDLTQALSFRLAKEMFLIGLEVQFTTNLRITPGWRTRCSPGAPEDDSF